MRVKLRPILISLNRATRQRERQHMESVKGQPSGQICRKSAINVQMCQPGHTLRQISRILFYIKAPLLCMQLDKVNVLHKQRFRFLYKK